MPQPTSLDDLRGLALRVRSDDHRPCDGEDPVQPARDDVAGEAGGESDDVHVGRRQRLRQHGARLVVEELDLVDLEQLRERDELGVSRAHPDDHDPDVVEVA